MTRMSKDELYRLTRYLLVGGWNVLFMVGVYALFYQWWQHQVHYLVLLIPVNILAMTNTYLCQKFFVFRTKGNFLREYLRCYVVYGGSMVLGFALMFVAVSLFGLHPVLAQGVCFVISTVYNYFGQKWFSFRTHEHTENL